MAEDATNGATHWSVDPERETVRAASPAEAVEEWLDEKGPEFVRPAETVVHGYRAWPLSDAYRKQLVDSALEHLRETLADDFAEPEDGLPSTSDQKAAARVFVTAFLADYRGWRLMDWVCQVVVPVPQDTHG